MSGGTSSIRMTAQNRDGRWRTICAGWRILERIPVDEREQWSAFVVWRGWMGSKPISITVRRSEAVLVIEWDDGQRVAYPLAGLRAACPCAECRLRRDEKDAAASPISLEVHLPPGASADLRSVEKVGNYALRLIWDDGHAYGIYSWDYLKALSPGEPAEDRRR